MKKGLFLMLVVVAMGCDEGVNDAQRKNRAPVVTMEGVKFKVTTGENGAKDIRQDIAVTVEDKDKNLQEVMVFSKESEGSAITVLEGGKERVLGKYYPLKDAERATLTYTVVFPFVGMAVLGVRVRDTFGKSGEKTVTLQAVHNVKPVAVLSVSEEGDGVYALDGSGSYDGDEDLGGEVAGYRFTFNGRVVTTKKSVINISLSEAKTYEIGLTVIDSDGAESDEVIENIIIE